MGSKRVVEYELYSEPQSGPVPARYILSIETADGWFYRYVALQRGDPFELRHKRRPDMKISTCDITPRSVHRFFEQHSKFTLVNEKVIYHGAYPEQ